MGAGYAYFYSRQIDGYAVVLGVIDQPAVIRSVIGEAFSAQDQAGLAGSPARLSTERPGWPSFASLHSFSYLKPIKTLLLSGIFLFPIGFYRNDLVKNILDNLQNLYIVLIRIKGYLLY
jgi:hypothetical protein